MIAPVSGWALRIGGAVALCAAVAWGVPAGAEFVLVEDFDVRLDPSAGTFKLLALWLMSGIFVGFLDRPYEVSCRISVDGSPPREFRTLARLDFFDRNRGLRELWLALVSPFAPTPVLCFDEEAISSHELDRIVLACIDEVRKH